MKKTWSIFFFFISIHWVRVWVRSIIRIMCINFSNSFLISVGHFYRGCVNFTRFSIIHRYELSPTTLARLCMFFFTIYMWAAAGRCINHIHTVNFKRFIRRRTNQTVRYLINFLNFSLSLAALLLGHSEKIRSDKNFNWIFVRIRCCCWCRSDFAVRFFSE